MKRFLLCLLLICAASPLFAQGDTARVYVFPIRENIMPSTVRLVNKCLGEARRAGADYVVIDMNTYGGLMDAADSIRTAILGFPIPVMVFVNNQAASAGALIALAADSIYMREGASMGAATVVGQDGEPVADKHQSFMRSMMRSTAEAHGRVDRTTGGATTRAWRRDPRIAEAMVDPMITIPGLVDSLKVLTLTPREAIEWGYCEGEASSVEDLLAKAGVDNYQIQEYRSTAMDGIMGFLTNPALQGILIMLIIAGIYFELQTPGIGFPLICSIAAALLYFAPLYIEGLAANWEIAIFLLGVALLVLEIFVTPGFGVLGVSGIVGIVLGLAFAMIDSSLFRHIPTGEVSAWFVFKPLLLVVISITTAFAFCLWLGPRFLKGESRLQKKVVLSTVMAPGEGYVSHAAGRNLVGRTGTVTAVLRPAGRVEIDGRLYDAAAEEGFFIDKGTPIRVARDEGGVLYCKKVE